MSNKQGYTLIELMVSIAIFSLIVAGPTGLFISALRNQNKAMALREIIDSSSNILEYISRSLRMAQKELNAPLCLSNHGLNYQQTNSRTLGGEVYSGSGIKFINHLGECQEFFLDQTDGHSTKNQLMSSKDGGLPMPITSNNLIVNKFEFQLSGEDQDDILQPRVTMLLEISDDSATGLPKITVQTTVSQRNLDVTY